MSVDRAKKAGGATGEVAYEWDLATDAIRWSADLSAFVGFDASRCATGLGYAEHLAAESATSRYDAVMALTGGDAGGGVPYEATYALRASRRSAAPLVWIEDRGLWHADGRDRPGHARGTIRVATARIEAERAALDAAQNPLSGAVGRAQFVEHLSRHLGAGRSPAPFAVLLIGIETGAADGLAASEMLIAAVGRLRAEMRAQEMCARHGATTFAVLLETCNAEQAEAAAQRFIAAIEAAPAGAAAPVARIGAVLAPCLGRTPQALLQLAEEALAAARRPESPACVRHDPETHRVAARPAAQDEVLAALNEGRVLLALQPVVAAGSRKPAFHEALVRIRRRDGTLLLPETLVPSAERNGLLAMLDRRVLELAFSMLTADRKLTLSINASVASLGDACWMDHLRAASRLRPDAARRLVVEIAEACVIADPDAASALLAEIKSLGARVAIDDFGAGQSSFKTLRQLQIDVLKIDGTFARGLGGSSDDRSCVRMLIDLARNLRIPIVAEWVEDEATARLLAEWGVDYLQGHLFGRALLDNEQKPARVA